jgi:hypothetical protein
MNPTVHVVSLRCLSYQAQSTPSLTSGQKVVQTSLIDKKIKIIIMKIQKARYQSRSKSLGSLRCRASEKQPC